MKNQKTVRIVLVTVFLLCVLIFLINASIGAKEYKKVTKEVDEVDVAAYIVSHRFIFNTPYTVDDLKDFPDAYTMIRALGDEESMFMSKDELQATISHLDNKYVGLGFEANKVEGKPFVISNVMPSTPALYCGLLEGDSIIKIDGKATLPMSNREAINLVRGEEGTQVTLTIERNKEVFDVILERKNIDGSLVESRMLDNEVGYISISNFAIDIYKEVVSHLVKLKNNGMKKLIIDLRGNSGGHVEEVAPILSMIMPYHKKVLYTIKHKDMDGIKYRRSNEIIFLGPLVVLCDENTASAAELFIASLRDFNRAVVIGEVTKGIQTTQTYFKMESGNVLKLSTGYMIVPKKWNFEGCGIKPDIEVSMEPLMKRNGFINEEIDSYNKRMKGVGKVLEAKYGGMDKAKEIIEIGDLQLDTAYNVIKGMK